MAFPRTVKLLGEVDDKLVRYAELHHLKPNEVIAEAVECFLRDRADIRMRLAEAIRVDREAHGPR